MKPREITVEDAVVRWANQHGILHTKLNLTFRRGWPDRVFWLVGGKPVFFEFKRKGAVPTALQRYTMKQLEQKGYDVNWSDSAEAAIAYLSRAAGIRNP